MRLRTLLWCRLLGHRWKIMPFPDKNLRVALYCTRCTQTRLQDREDSDYVWVATHRFTKRYRRKPKLPVATVRKS